MKGISINNYTICQSDKTGIDTKTPLYLYLKFNAFTYSAININSFRLRLELRSKTKISH